MWRGASPDVRTRQYDTCTTRTAQSRRLLRNNEGNMYDPLRAKAKVALYGGLTFFLGLGIASGLGWTRASLAMPVVNEQPALTTEAVKPAADLSEAFVNIADVVTPAVVRIQTRRPARMVGRETQNLFRFFGDPNERPNQQQQPEPEMAGGSGFIATADG